MHSNTTLHDHYAAVARRLLDGNEKLMPLGQACQFVASTRGEKVHTSSLCRWILRGKSGVRLDAVRLNGGGWWTSREALSRFAAALSARVAGKAEIVERVASGADEANRERRCEAAKVRLRAMGVKV